MYMSDFYYIVEFDVFSLKEDFVKINGTSVGFYDHMSQIRSEHDNIGYGRKFKTEKKAKAFFNRMRKKYSQSPWVGYIHQTEGCSIGF